AAAARRGEALEPGRGGAGPQDRRVGLLPATGAESILTRCGPKSAHATPGVDQKVRTRPRVWTKKCARRFSKPQKTLRRWPEFASTTHHHPSQGDVVVCAEAHTTSPK